MELYKIIINYSNSGNPETLDKAGAGVPLADALEIVKIFLQPTSKNIESVEIRRIDK
jgi:hypothetical protein